MILNKTGLVGQKLRLCPESWGRLGEATTVVNGHRVFVFGGIPGEEVVAEVFRERRGYVAARVVEVLKPSPLRIAAPCPYFGACTGCQWQHVSYEAQLQIKRDVVVDALERVGGFDRPPVTDALQSQDRYGYRNHARFTIGKDGSLGFVNKESRQMVPVDSCMIMDPSVNRILGELQGRCAETSQLSVRCGVNTGDFLVQPTLKTAEVSIATGQKHYVESLRGRRFRVASPSFFQVNIRQLDRLVDLVKEELELSGSELVVDAYAGVGTFALLLAPYAGRVIAIEESPAAVEDALANADDAPRVEFIQGRTEQVLSELEERPQGLILDPPRKGCHPSALEALKRLKPQRVVYVSCDPATLARDLKSLCRETFLLEKVRPVDMFPQTHHVECIATLTLRRGVDGLVLASSSPRRRDLMAGIGIPFEIEAPEVDEATFGEFVEDTVKRLALAKAQAVANRRPGQLVVGADTMVFCDGEALGKPRDPAQAVEMLQRLRGRDHRVVTGVAVMDGSSGASLVDICESVVEMRDYSDQEIDAYVSLGEAMDKAGAYGIQDTGFSPASRTTGCYSNVVGLPLCTLANLLNGLGFDTEPLRIPDECRAHRDSSETKP